MSLYEILPLLILPLAGTIIGASPVLFVGNQSADKVRSIMLGFASGVMVAASVWSLLIPAMEESANMGNLAWLPATAGFLLGVLFMLLLDTFTPHLHHDSDTPEGPKSRLGRSSMLVLAVTLHNIPEGMAVGVVFAGLKAGGTNITMAAALALSIGIAIQNFPEGAIISLPLKEELGKGKAFTMGILSGVVEPVAAAITFLLATYITPFIPYTLAFAAGAMLYVAVEELIPQAHSRAGSCGFVAGFLVMMALDVALG